MLSNSVVASTNGNNNWKEILLNGYKKNETSLEALQPALVEMLRELFKILPLDYQKKGSLFHKSVQGGVKSQKLRQSISNVVLNSIDDKLANYIGQLMIELKMIDIEGNGSTSLMQDNKRVRFLQPYLPRLVIGGGGHAGFSSACQLHEYYSVVLIDKNSYLSYKPAYPLVLENADHSDKISFKFTESLPSSVTFIQGIVKSVNQNGVFIDLIDSSPSQQVKNLFTTTDNNTEDLKNCKYLPFDYLVVATGSNAWKNLPKTDGVEDNEIVYVDSYNFDMIKNSVNSIKQSDESKAIVVIGGGVVGSEYFGSLAHTFPNRKVYLIQRSDLIMRPSQDANKAAIETFSKMKNAVVMMNSQVVRQSDSETLVVSSDDGGKETSIKCCVCYLATGNSPNTGMMQDFFSNSLDESGYLKVNSSFQLFKSNSEYYRNIFVLGDANNSDSQKLIQNADLHVDKFVEIAKSIVEFEKEFPIYESAVRVMAVSLGPKTGFIIKGEKVVLKSGISNKVKGLVASTTQKKYKKYSKK